MPKTLILMRHAKSSWRDLRQADQDRPLNPRGEIAARFLGDWLRAGNYLPDQALVSTACRTQETFALLGLALTPDLNSHLYHAPLLRLLDTLRAAEGDSVLLIGHNPGVAAFAGEILSHRPDHPRFADYPTGATLVARFDIAAWSQLKPGSGQLVDFVTPRDLET